MQIERRFSSVVLKILALIFVLSPFSAVFASELIVPDDFATIQAAIDSAKSGDEIVVREGTYYENISIAKEAIVIRSLAGASRTIIDGSKSGSVVSFLGIEGIGSELDGFTIRNGESYRGGGINSENSSPKIVNCVISANSAEYGGGIYSSYSDLMTVINCDIYGNRARDSGGGIYLEMSSPTIADCRIVDNSAERGGGIYCLDSSSPTISLTSITDNRADYGGGLYCLNSSSPNVVQSSISRNRASFGGAVYTMTASNPVIYQSTMDGNTASLLSDLVFYFDAVPEIADCSINGSDSEYGEGIICHLLRLKHIIKSDNDSNHRVNSLSYSLIVFELLILKLGIFAYFKNTWGDSLIAAVEENVSFKEHSTSVHEYLKKHI